MATYKALADCVVFDVYRRAGEQFRGPEWCDAYAWPMPKHLARIDAPAAPEQQRETENQPSVPVSENAPAAPEQQKRGRGGRPRKA